MNRHRNLDRIRSRREPWDVAVIGGGATGLGVAVDASARGYATVLVDQSDFGKGTSSRSTKLVHGGVRYLQQGNVGLVLEALRERGILLRNAPHLVHHLSFVVPAYDWWEGPFYGVGLKLYDALAGKWGIAPSRILSLRETVERIPTVERDGLRGGALYHDAQFDDARLAVTLARTADSLGAAVANYVRVEGLVKDRGLVRGIEGRDVETGDAVRIEARVVVNATGVFADSVRALADPANEPVLAPSQGVHLVLDRSFQPGESAVLVPYTDDGRVLFAVPWRDRVVIGTTDTPVARATIEPVPLDEEIEFLLAHAARYLEKDPTRADVLSAFAGLRPLVRGEGGKATAALSRDHSVLVSQSGLVTIAGGKWTTYRKMAEDTVDQAAIVGGLEERDCPTRTLRLVGWTPDPELESPWDVYGSEAAEVRALAASHPGGDDPIHPDLPYRLGEVVWAARREMARTAEDVLSRRTRSLLLDARAAAEAAPEVARILASEIGGDAAWAERDAASFRSLAKGYLPSGVPERP